MDTTKIFQICSAPKAAAQEIEAWGTLQGGPANASVIKVGLFSYDISCLATYCALLEADDQNYCPFIEVRGLDGLAFGVHFEIENQSSTSYYCAGFKNEGFTDVAVCGDYETDMYTYYWAQNYTVTNAYFLDTTERQVYSESPGYYGMSVWKFEEGYYDGLEGAEFTFNSAFRFIGADENGGYRWSAGDTLDMFYLDFENNEVEISKNEGFELAGAAPLTLAAEGIALILAILM